VNATGRWLALLLVLGAGLRLVVNDVALYSPADERHYVEQTQLLVDRGFFAGYPELVARQLGDVHAQLLPPPLRWGYLGLTTTAARLSGRCEPRTLAWLSTLAGIAVLPLAFALGRRWVGPAAALLGVALCVTSPLQLALGRRALSDEPLCAAVLLALWTTLRALDQREGGRGRGRTAAAVAAWTLLLAIKETGLLLLPVLVLLVVLDRRARGVKLARADAWLLVAPPLVYLGVLFLLTRDAAAIVALLRAQSANAGTASNEYSALFQGGPPHRLLLDLFALMPLVFVLAVAAVARVKEASGGPRQLILVTVAMLALFSAMPAKNVRFVAGVDPLLRLLAAWLLTTQLRPRSAALVTTLNGALELALFSAVFLTGNVYDPVSYNVLKALRFFP
jgi:4-amino-4-deoxy-L-arabinose transferase-like glycosyltransferase